MPGRRRRGSDLSPSMKDWDARIYRERTGFVSELGMPVVELLDPRRGERVLDVGCGDGALTEKLTSLGCEVVAIDSSGEMVEAARARGLDARVMNAAQLIDADRFAGEFDAVFSNAALHWMHPMAAVAAGIFRCLRTGGRFVAEFGGEGNVAGIRTAIHEALRQRGVSATAVDPWHFPSLPEYSALLTETGFEIRDIGDFERPTPLTGGIRGWIEAVGRPFLRAVSEGERESLLADIEALLPRELRGDDGTWCADYVRLRVFAVKPFP